MSDNAEITYDVKNMPRPFRICGETSDEVKDIIKYILPEKR